MAGFDLSNFGIHARRAAARVTQRPFNEAHLWTIWIGSIIIYIISLLRPFSLLRLYNLPHQYLGPLTNHAPSGAFRYAISMIGLLLLYALGWQICRRLIATPAVWRLVIGGSILTGAMLLFVQPYGAGDIYDYFFTGHVSAQYAANPYLFIPKDYADDLYFQFVGWQHIRSVYGPLWQLLGIGAVTLTQSHLLAGLLAYKLVVLVAFIATTLVIRRILQRLAPALALQGTYLFAWCPLVLIETAVNGHNDSVMTLGITLCFLALSHKRIALALAGLSSAVLVKYTALLFLPLILLYLWLEMPGYARDIRPTPWTGTGELIRAYLPDRQTFLPRLNLLMQAAAGFALPVVLLYAPFWVGWHTLDALRDYPEMWTTSPSAVLFYNLRNWLGDDMAGRLSIQFSLALLASAYTSIVLWQRHTGILALAARCGILLWIYLLVCNPWFQPWYLIWLASLVALDIRPVHFWRFWAFLLGTAASYLFWSYPFFWQPWGARQLESQTMATLLAYTPPLLVLLWESFQVSPRSGDQ